MIGSAGVASNCWYIGDLSNGTFAPCPRCSRDLDKRNLFPEAILKELIGAFKHYSNENLQELAYAVIPNSFHGLPHTKTSDTDLRMVDATESGTVSPLWGQLQPSRGLVFSMVWDDDEDTTPYAWNNGTNLYAVYQFAKRTKKPFLIVPKLATMIKRNYTTRPVFFGYDANLTTTNSTSSPIVLYLANAPYSACTDYTWTQPTIGLAQINKIFVNSFYILTQGNGTLDSE